MVPVVPRPSTTPGTQITRSDHLPEKQVRKGPPGTSVPGDLPVLAKSYERYLRAANRSPRTVQTYLETVTQLTRFLESAGFPGQAAALRREHLEAFMTDILARHKPATASNRFRALQQFFRYLVDEGEIDRSPLDRMAPPQVPEQPVPVLSEDDLRTLFGTSHEHLGASGSATGFLSDASCIKSLAGPFTGIGGTAGGASGEYQWGNDDAGRHVHVLSGGPGAGVEGHWDYTSTTTWTFLHL